MYSERIKELKNWLGKDVHVVIDRPLGYVHGSIVYPINYGYIPDVIAGDGEEQDVYILGVDEPLAEFDGRVIGGILRRDDCEDKLIVAPVGVELHQAQIADAVHFQEQFFDSCIISAYEKSCGVLPYRISGGEMEFLLVFEEFSRCWSIPKGHMERGETEVQTVLRELYEETSLTAEPEWEKMSFVEYPISKNARKRVEFYLGAVSGMPRVRDGEIGNFKWVSKQELARHLYPDMAHACLQLLE